MVARVLFISGVIALILAPVVFILAVGSMMEDGDCIPGSGPCPTVEGVAIGAGIAGVVLAMAWLLIALALIRGFGKRRNKRDP